MIPAISIRGAREHNLAGVDLDIPRDKLVVITGPSGSGKTSLAFDTLYAEGQRRYVESLSVHARRFLERFARPKVEVLEGLSPAISVPQGRFGRHPRSTLATITEIYDHLRLLFARTGEAHCPSCGRALRAFSVPEIVERLFLLPARARIIILAPLGEIAHEMIVDRLAALRREGFSRIEVDGEVRALDEVIALSTDEPHALSIVVDRLLLKTSSRGRLAESLELALGHAQGRVVVRWAPGRDEAGEDLFFADRLYCPLCDRDVPELTPQLFSFNAPQGACPRCGGLGKTLIPDPARVVPDPDRSLADGAILPWAQRNVPLYRARLSDLAAALGFSLETPWRELSDEVKEILLAGSGERTFPLRVRGPRSRRQEVPFEGVLADVARRHEMLLREEPARRDADASGEASYAVLIDELEAFMRSRPCPACAGARLRPEALAVKVGGMSIAEISALSVRGALTFFRALEVEGARGAVVERIVEAIVSRLGFLDGVGVGYLGLDRTVTTLSSGEAQRVRLATQIGASLTGVLYVLDEPSRGLHPRDGAQLIATLAALRDRGNTVIVVEHDEATIRAADFVVDLGPGAGVEGGRVIAQGSVAELIADEASVTGAYLAGRREVVPPREARGRSRKRLQIRGATTHNLKGVDVDIPLGRFVCVTGVSGSGKSSLVMHTLLPVLRATLGGARRDLGACQAVEGVEYLEKVVSIDQAPLGRTSRANAATTLGILPLVRELFAELPEARMRGWKPGRFSFNVPGGRCEVCKGEGRVRVPMHFLPDMFVTCDVCQGRRFDDETLRVRYRGRSIADLLDLSILEAREALARVPRIREKLDVLISVGLGYLTLGQPADTLSGGEAQRVKLARELARRSPERTLYLLDEPTTGLHFSDVELLLGVLHRLVEAGASVLVIEHDVNVIRSADWVIDLGPEGGDAGGEIVATGTPDQVAAVEASPTGRFLREALVSRRETVRLASP